MKYLIISSILALASVGVPNDYPPQPPKGANGPAGPAK